MAKNQNQDENVETMADAAVIDAAAAAEVPSTDERYVMIKHDKTGEMVKRKDFILECWQERKMSRGEIAKLLTDLQGKKVPYQIVFAATKKIAGGPDKAETPATTEGTPAEGAAEAGTTIGG